MKIVFAGTPVIAATVLNHLIKSDFPIELVLTQPDRPQGRGNKVTPPPVKILAQNHHIEVLQPQSLKNNPLLIEKIATLNPDIIIVIAYGMIIPNELLEIPKLGCVNIHVSLLPKWRGAAPIQRAIINGDTTTGVTIMQMDSGLDTGNILLQQEINITENDNSQTIHDKLAILGAEMIVTYLNNYPQIKPIIQPEIGVSYAHKILKSEAQINWHENAKLIKQKIAGFNPSPGAFSNLNGNLIKLWNAKIVNKQTSQAAPGSIIKADKQLFVACGNNTILEILELQSAGKSQQSALEFINGNPNLLNQKFDILIPQP